MLRFLLAVLPLLLASLAGITTTTAETASGGDAMPGTADLPPQLPSPGPVAGEGGGGQAADGADDAGADADGSVPGSVHWSDGTVVKGRISLAPGGQLRIHDGHTLLPVNWSDVREILISPESEEMARPWRFLNAGQTVKQFTGPPYPVRHLKARIVLIGGSELTGHLFTTVIVVRHHDTQQRIFLLSKLHGEPNQTLASLLYPTLIELHPPKDANPPSTRVHVSGLAKAPDEVVVMPEDGLVRMDAASVPSQPGVYTIPPCHGDLLYVALRTGSVLRVGWPAHQDPVLMKAITKALGEETDFFDEKRLIGVRRGVSGAVYSLVLLVRRGATTDGAWRPWRLEIWRWHLEAKTTLLAGHDYFYRGRVTDDHQLPTVIMDPRLWPSTVKAGTYEVGGP